MPDFSLMPVDHQPDFGDVSLVPVDHDPFSADGPTQQTQVQPAQFQPASSSQLPATRTAQLNVGPPANGDGTGGPPSGAAAGGDPNSTQNQNVPSEPVPFSGFANPTPAESLVNKQKMDDQADLVDADQTGNSGSITDGDVLYKFVTTGPTRRYPIDGATGTMIIATSPFYAFDGTRHAFIEASPERPLMIKVPEDGKFTINRP